MELQLRRSPAALSPELDRSAALAAAPTHGETGHDVAESFGGNPELMPDQSSPGGGRSDPWKYQSAPAAWSWLPESRLPAAEGATLGRYQDRIRGLSESRLECTFLQIVVQSPKRVQPVIWIPEELTARLPLTTADL